MGELNRIEVFCSKLFRVRLPRFHHLTGWYSTLWIYLLAWPSPKHSRSRYHSHSLIHACPLNPVNEDLKPHFGSFRATRLFSTLFFLWERASRANLFAPGLHKGVH